LDGPRSGGSVRAAAIICILDAVALVGYAVALGVASRSSRGSSVNAAGVEIAIYLAFAVLMGLLARGLARRRPLARTPFLLSQLFVIIIGYTVFAGDGTAVTVVGGAVMLLGLIGVALSLSPRLAEALAERDPDER
jgi:hypothetical protein